MKQQRTAVVTGASSGIGWGAVKVLAASGFHVFGSVRNESDGRKLAAEFGDRFTPLLFDVTDEAAVHRGADQVRAALGGRRLGGLVNNAGIALAGPLANIPIDVFRRQLEVNLTGVLIATQAFLPLLGSDPDLKGEPGRIVNIGSVGGRHAFPFMGPYHVSKYGLEGFTESLRRELMLFGVDATLVAPGTVATEIWGKADAVDYSTYDNTAYKASLQTMRKEVAGVAKGGFPPERIGEAILKQLTDAHPPVYRRVTPQPATFIAMTSLPKRMIDKVIARRMGLIKR
jgi:NAD(P)-dependent dehydrogenase (short-subunit alcohol dehydrogenase family)